jgi:hypothetical protein
MDKTPEFIEWAFSDPEIDFPIDIRGSDPPSPPISSS